MRITELHIDEWRNLRNVHANVTSDSSLISLVGSNGTGKTNLLELLSYAATQLGLASGIRPTQRTSPPQQSGFHVTLAVSPDFEVDPNDVTQTFGNPQPQLFEAWDRTLTLWRLPFVPSDPPPGIPRGHAGEFVLAGGVPSQQSSHFGAAIVRGIARKQELNHLFLDAERAYAATSIQDQEILAASREDPDEPSIVRQRALANSQNMYLEWIRATLGLEHRYAAEFARQHRIASEAGAQGPEYQDPWKEFREAISHVMPHLAFDRADQNLRTLIFRAGGAEIPYHELSGGEREVAFLIGQLIRFRLRRGLLLLDEPELHLNAELLERWLVWASTRSEGQIWIATHSLEAIEVAGPASAFVLERASDGLVHGINKLSDRPIMSTLAGALGAPAFSLDRQRFVLIEGERPGRERNRFAALCPGADNLFLEAGNCAQVLTKVGIVTELARETDRIRVGGIIDRDHWDARQCQRFADEAPVFVLGVHEVENLLLMPDALSLLAERNGDPRHRAKEILQGVSDRFAGLWIVQHAAIRHNIDLGANIRGQSGSITWADIAGREEEMADNLSQSAELTDSSIRPQVKQWLLTSIRAYAQARDGDDLWKLCSGKQVLSDLPSRFGIANADSLERQVLQMLKDDDVSPPPELVELRNYIADIAP